MFAFAIVYTEAETMIASTPIPTLLLIVIRKNSSFLPKAEIVEDCKLYIEIKATARLITLPAYNIGVFIFLYMILFRTAVTVI